MTTNTTIFHAGVDHVKRGNKTASPGKAVPSGWVAAGLGLLDKLEPKYHAARGAA